MIDEERKKYGIEMAERMDEILTSTIDQLMGIALQYDGKLYASDVVAITEITVQRFAKTFKSAAAKTNKLMDELNKSNNNHT